MCFHKTAPFQFRVRRKSKYKVRVYHGTITGLTKKPLDYREHFFPYIGYFHAFRQIVNKEYSRDLRWKVGFKILIRYAPWTVDCFATRRVAKFKILSVSDSGARIFADQGIFDTLFWFSRWCTIVFIRVEIVLSRWFCGGLDIL